MQEPHFHAPWQTIIIIIIIQSAAFANYIHKYKDKVT